MPTSSGRRCDGSAARTSRRPNRSRPLASTAQAVRAILSASATAATLAGRRRSSSVTQGYLFQAACGRFRQWILHRGPIVAAGSDRPAWISSRDAPFHRRSFAAAPIRSRLQTRGRILNAFGSVIVATTAVDRIAPNLWNGFEPFAVRIGAMGLSDALVEPMDLGLHCAQVAKQLPDRQSVRDLAAAHRCSPSRP